MSEITLQPDPASIGVARRHVRENLALLADEDTVAEVELVVSELVTNSLRHGPGDRPILLRLSEEDGVIAGEVEDKGDGTVQIRESDPGSTVGGLGLPIVDRVTSDWGVHPGSTHVWFRFDR